MKNILGTVSVIALAAALASPAFAADLPARTYTKAPMVSPAYNWSGFYVGVMGGYAWSDERRPGSAVCTYTDQSDEL